MADEHQLPLQQLYRLVESGPAGITNEEASRRLERYGHNELHVQKETLELVKFLRQFKNFFALLLLGGAALAFTAERLSPGEGNLQIGVALLGVVVLNAVFTYIQAYHSERIMESFKEMLPALITVRRAGKTIEIPTRELVPGDVMLLEEGEKIPADGRLIVVNALKVDQSSLTGESEPQLRKLECTHEHILESRNMVFSGTLVQSGNGEAVVYGTGMNTQIGRIVQLTKETAEVETPIRKELNRFITIISAIAIILGVAFFTTSIFLGKPFIASLIFAIGIIVANVPEGLLPTVTLSLSIASQRMAKKQALIKNLESVETLGSTTVICTDKTGTITQNRMSVATMVLNEKERAATDPLVNKEAGVSVAWAAMALCNNARVEEGRLVGDPTETALLAYATRLKPVKALVERLQRIHETPFDSATKRMITTHHARGKRENLAYLKGAPEAVLARCNKAYVDGKETRLTAPRRRRALDDYERLARRGERVLALAFKETTEEKVAEEGFVYVGLVGMLDPPRPEIPEAIAKCRSAGIRVFMVTGDYALTAEAIARQANVYTGDGKVVTGDELELMNDEALSRLLDERELIFARTTPLHKLRIVKALRAKGEVVTVTGDGVNDAPALKNGDMGVAMGLSGTDVAKEASDMVLMDDNFATIVNAVEEGRTIFANIKKFIAYILTSNIPEIVPFIAFVLLNIPLPLTVVLILAIDLGTDIVPALGLGIESPESDVMALPPRPKNERLLSPQLLGISYGIIGVLQAIAGFTAYFTVLFTGGWQWGEALPTGNPLYATAVSAFFAAIIICQVADVMICRSRRQSLFTVGLFKNKLVLLGLLTELSLLALILYVPPVSNFFGTAPLTIGQLLLGVPFALATIAFGEGRKFLVRRGNQFVTKYLTW